MTLDPTGAATAPPSYEQALATLTAPGGPFALVDGDDPRRARAAVRQRARDAARSSSTARATKGDATWLVYENERYSYAQVPRARRRARGAARAALRDPPRRSRRDRDAQLPRVDLRVLRGHRRSAPWRSASTPGGPPRSSTTACATAVRASCSPTASDCERIAPLLGALAAARPARRRGALRGHGERSARRRRSLRGGDRAVRRCRAAGRDGRARRRRDDPLHLGHDGASEGCRVDAPRDPAVAVRVRLPRDRQRGRRVRRRSRTRFRPATS